MEARSPRSTTRSRRHHRDRRAAFFVVGGRTIGPRRRRYRLLRGHRPGSAISSLSSRPRRAIRSGFGLPITDHRTRAATRSSVRVLRGRHARATKAPPPPGRSSSSSAAAAPGRARLPQPGGPRVRAARRAGVAILGANAQGKTNLLEAIYYPVLFRSLRGRARPAGDPAATAGFRVEADVDGGSGRQGRGDYLAAGRRSGSRSTARSRPAGRCGGSLARGRLSAVRCRPRVAARRRSARQYLDRLLSLADRALPAGAEPLPRGPGATEQRAAAGPAGPGRRRSTRRWPLAGAELRAMRERVGRRRGGAVREPSSTASASAAERHAAISRCEPAGRPGRLGGRARGGAVPADRARGLTTVGPHRDDLVLEIGGRAGSGVRLHRPAAERRGGAQADRDRHAARGPWHRAGVVAGRCVRRAGPGPAGPAGAAAARARRAAGVRDQPAARTSCRRIWSWRLWIRWTRGPVSSA